MISKQASVSVVAYPNLSKQNRFTCICCRIKFESTELQRAHFKSDWHLYNLKRKICNLEPIDLDNYNSIQAASPTEQQEDEETSSVSSSSFVDLSMKSPDKQEGGASDFNEDEEDWVRIDGDKFLDEEYDDEDIDELLARIVKSCTCLFCDKKNSNTEDNINHMNLMHGFFIPEEQYMIDLAGFMEYLGFKVGVDATCLWCNKQFTSLHGVRLHMVNKDHCKIFYNQEKATNEFKEFYDYSSQEEFQMKPINELVIVKKRRERRTSFDGPFIKSQSPGCSDNGKAVEKKCGQSIIGESCQARTNKRFDSYRAKIILRTAASNNKTLRARFRHQNPI